jgi:dihydrodipicolinate synthase/N-acetylneuraminate lyase
MTGVPALRRRPILGMSAVLLPFTADRAVDWLGFESLLARTVEAGLVPAVNMDTGYVQLLDADTRARVLQTAARSCGAPGFVAGAFVADEPGAPLDIDAYLGAIDAISASGGTPVIFPSHGLNSLADEEWVAAHEAIGRRFDRFIGFELGPMFVQYGRIYSLAAYEGLLGVRSCIGAKHSSLSRAAEWDRLEVRDRVRSEFHVFTGNDLAIDMVCYGSDYLLGLSAFAPEAFAERDRRWESGERSFHELNDLLQYLGAFAFRAPVPAYRHDAALFLQLRGQIDSDTTPSGASRRPESDRAVLTDIAQRLETLV